MQKACSHCIPPTHPFLRRGLSFLSFSLGKAGGATGAAGSSINSLLPANFLPAPSPSRPEGREVSLPPRQSPEPSCTKAHACAVKATRENTHPGGGGGTVLACSPAPELRPCPRGRCADCGPLRGSRLTKDTKAGGSRGTWVAQSVKRAALDLSSGLDLMGHEFGPRIGLCTDGAEPA